MCDISMFVAEEAARTAVSILTSACLAGLSWLLLLRHRTAVLKALVSNPHRVFVLHFRANEGQQKRLTFLADGSIGEGQNHNEHYWDVRYGSLQIRTASGVVYSRFKWNSKKGRLVHVNDPALPSVMGQFIIPLFVPRSARGETCKS